MHFVRGPIAFCHTTEICCISYEVPCLASCPCPTQSVALLELVATTCMPVEPSLRRCFHPLPIVDILSGCDITSMGICLSRGCPSPCCCASLDPPVSYVYRGLRPPRLTVSAAVGSSPGSLAVRGSNALADVASPMSRLDDCLSRLLAPTQPLGRK